jgi:hypothetical protein
MIDRLSKTWELYRSIAKSELELCKVPDEKKTCASVNDLRELLVFPPIYFAVTEQALTVGDRKLFKCIVLTEEIILGWIDIRTPIVPLYDQKVLLVCLPFWIYLDEQFLYDYTVERCKLGDNVVASIQDYANSTSIPNDVRGDYMKHIMGLLAPYNTSFIFDFIDEIENYEFDY